MIDRNKVIRTLFFFCAGVSASLATVSCEQGQMYCMVTSNQFAMTLKKTSGGDCLPPVDTFHAEHYLGLDKKTKTGVPSDPSVSVVLDSAHNAYEAAKKHAEALQDYAMKCPNPDPMVDTMPNLDFMDATYWGLSDFEEARPDGDGKCIAKDFKEVNFSTPAMSAIPACADNKELKPQPALLLKQFKYKVKEIEVTASPEIIGLEINGKLDYEGPGPDGQTCTASYTFNALTPVVECAKDKDCTSVKEKDSPAKKINGTLRKRGLYCYKAPMAEKGICAFKKVKK